MTDLDDRRTRRPMAAAAALAPVLASVLALTACGSSGPSSAAAANAPGQASGRASGQAGQGSGRFGSGQSGRGFPGTSGRVADVTGSTAQVQGPTSQTAVTWTRTTVFTAQTRTTSSTLRVGDCVSARPALPAGAPGSRVTGTPAPTPTPSSSESSVAAATVEIFPATNGTCEQYGLAGVLGGFGDRTGAPTPTRTGGQQTPPPGGPNGFGAGLRGATGRVTALGRGSFTVEPVARRGADGATTATTGPVTVTYAADTTFTSLGTSAASAVKVGACMTAFGKADDTGALTATSIQLSQPVGGSCTTAFRDGAGRPGATATGTPNA